MEREIILSQEEIHNICKDIANKLDTRFAADNVKTPIIIGVLKGSVNFMMDLTKYMKTDLYKKYGNKTLLKINLDDLEKMVRSSLISERQANFFWGVLLMEKTDIKSLSFSS